MVFVSPKNKFLRLRGQKPMEKQGRCFLGLFPKKGLNQVAKIRMLFMVFGEFGDGAEFKVQGFPVALS